MHQFGSGRPDLQDEKELVGFIAGRKMKPICSGRKENRLYM